MARRDIVLDSSILIQHMRARNKSESLLVRSLSGFEPFLSVVSVYEIELGALRAGRISDMDTLRTSFGILTLTEEIARRAAAIDAALFQRNKQIGIKDSFIAATCLELDPPLLTVNMRHFEYVDDIQLIEPDSLPPA